MRNNILYIQKLEDYLPRNSELDVAIGGLGLHSQLHKHTQAAVNPSGFRQGSGMAR